MYQPDVIVKEPGSQQMGLIVEIKSVTPVNRDWFDQLRYYMWSCRCPVGLLVTPEVTTVFVDTYSDRTIDAIVIKDEIETEKLFGPIDLPSGANASKLHDVMAQAVQDWLSRLAENRIELPDARAASIAREIILPAVANSEIEAGRPRWR